ncbi:MAG: terminase [Nitrospirales bacterium]|nr:MAG: terminase [Nitrospirales bacterium]
MPAMSVLTPQIERLRHAFLSTISPDEDLLPSQWAEKYRIVSAEATGAKMAWSNDFAPYLVEPMDTFHPSCPSDMTIVLKPTQVGASEAMNSLIGWIIHQERKSCMMTQPIIDAMELYSDTRIKTMIRDSPVLAELVSENSRDETNRKLFKTFPGGFLRMSGANSATSLKSIPVPYFVGDEVDEWPMDCDGQGSPLGLVMKRTDRYSERKIWLSSTPTVQGKSLISDQYEKSSKGKYHVPCLKCGHYQFLDWNHLVYKNREYPAYECDSCNRLIDESEKMEMLLSGKWVHEFPDQWVRRGFYLNGLYSPIGFKNDWGNMVREWLEAVEDLKKKRSKLGLVTFKQSRLAEAVKPDDLEDDEPDVEEIQARCEDYPERLPKAIKLLTCGIDIQDSWVEAEIMGWGAGRENWSLDWQAFQGSPGVGPQDGVWQQLALYIQETWITEDGRTLRPVVTCVDTRGHYTNESYKFCQQYARLGVVATAGYNTPGKPLISMGSTKKGVRLYLIGTETSKDTIFAHLNVTQPGPGYCHFPKSAQYDDEYFKQLFSEEPKTRVRSGKRVRVYEQRRRRNEKLDLRSLNYVSLELADPRYMLINKPETTESDAVQVERRSVMQRTYTLKSNWVNRYRR